MRLSTLNFLSYESRTTNRAAPLLFAGFIALQLVALLAFVRYFFASTWDQQLSSGSWAIVLTCLICNLVLCFGEYFFHRYVIHIETVRFMRDFCAGHLTHHKLTSIRFDDAENRVRSAFPISDVEHDDQATFPPCALIAFFAFFTPFFAPMAFSFPRLPILIGGYTAIAIAHFLYEMIHMVHHKPYDVWWKDKLSGRIFGEAWRTLYGFHQAHHANYRCNLNVAGFFGIPLADMAFGTYKQPEALLLDGTPATKESARRLTPQPRWPISWLDKVVLKRRRWMSKEECREAPLAQIQRPSPIRAKLEVGKKRRHAPALVNSEQDAANMSGGGNDRHD
jgi:sterol desaturase/sphingolipid hydroxylase (fatty acid hydroxylase superfamily)